MKTSIIAFLAPLLASAAAVPNALQDNSVATKSDVVIKCDNKPALDNRHLEAAREKFAHSADTGEWKQYMPFFAYGEDEEDAQVYICNYQQLELDLTRAKINQWMTDIDHKCGVAKGGWIDNIATEGNFGRGQKRMEDFC
ncbi:unnamed protein product [Periconia digitata]|uniref:Uncharacterized protein n=1 Tax=Periconia digitata TaxID=1303443 RepID=A0A9W4UWI8_9PLEO|nr:unnamed protein product [Periconia digitata]